MPIPAAILSLVERFRDNHDAYRSGAYNETQLRREFLDPFFKALGWDVDNTSDHAEAYKDVVHEDAVKVGGATKAPDYSFRVGGRRVFFLEAKKPSVNIRDDVAPAYQLRRYAWSANLPLSIVSDFEEFAVYDCRIKPAPGDKTAKGRLLYLTFDEYEKRWDEIASVFSKEAVLKGGFDRYAKQTQGKRGTTGVDADFLAQMEDWRDLLAKNIALRNPGLAVEQLNQAVQATIDRIVFLRICEDRGIEPFNRLQGLCNGPGVYMRLVQQFRAADERYNSGLFHFNAEKGRPGTPDDFTPGLAIDDKPLKEIVAALYYPQSPYEFSVLPADILGQVYERFLGKVIRLTGSGQAKVEDKPEVKKAGGVFYTPTWVVDYIVAETLGRLVQGKTPKQAEKQRVLDPACGSGSFLLGAYQWLLDWHLAWYVANDPAKHAKGSQARVYAIGNAWRLTAAERKRILLNNIHGVDIDPQACEVTKLSLLLKVLEGETDETLNAQMRLFHERALPDLDGNIQCGNSLVGPDFFDGRLELDADERRRINAFDWSTAFPDARAVGGFDAVIGNPPYVRIQVLKEFAPIEVEYYKQRYLAAATGNYDLYVAFVERGLQLISKTGRLGFILPHKFFNAQYGAPLRGLISQGKHLAGVLHLGHQQVFAGATTYTCLLFLERQARKDFRFERVDDLAALRGDDEGNRPHPSSGQAGIVLPQPVGENEWNFAAADDGGLRLRLGKSGPTLGELARIFQGLVTGADKVFVLRHVRDIGKSLVVVADVEGSEWTLESGLLKPFLSHVSLASHAEPQAQHWLIFPYSLEGGAARLLEIGEIERHYPRTLAYLQAHARALRDREGGKWHHAQWYAFGRSQNLAAFDAPKLVVQVISQTGRYAYDDARTYFTGGGNGPYYGIRWRDNAQSLSLHYLQALLNSRLLDWVLHGVSSPFRGGYWSYGKRFIEQLPIVVPDLASKAGREQHDHLAGLAQRLLALHRDLGDAAGMERTRIEREIAALSAQADRAVYALYDLNEEDIALMLKSSVNKEGGLAV